MSTVLSATVEMKDPDKFKEYSPKAIASMEPCGGKLMRVHRSAGRALTHFITG